MNCSTAARAAKAPIGVKLSSSMATTNIRFDDSIAASSAAVAAADASAPFGAP